MNRGCAVGPDPLPPAGQRTSLSHTPWVEFPGVVDFAFPRDFVVVNFGEGNGAASSEHEGDGKTSWVRSSKSGLLIGRNYPAIV
jgi:hypothetical protein